MNLRSQAPRACAMPGFATPWHSRCGRNRTADLVLPKHVGYQATPRTDMKSAQRELNPHFRHGKAVGCRYIMGASNRWSNCQRSEHRTTEYGGARTRTHVAADQPSVGARGAESSPLARPVLFVQVGPEGLEPSPTWLRARHAAANTLIPSYLLFV